MRSKLRSRYFRVYYDNGESKVFQAVDKELALSMARFYWPRVKIIKAEELNND